MMKYIKYIIFFFLLNFNMINIKILAETEIKDKIFDIKIEPTEGEQALLEVLNNLPVVNQLAPGIAFIALLSKFKIEKGSPATESAITILSSILGLTGDAAGDGDTDSLLAFQNTFNTNQHCSKQFLYREELQYVSKQGGGRANGGVGVFPVVPKHIQLQSNQCKIENSVITNDYFPLDSKCSYNYNPENLSYCFFRSTLVILIADILASVASNLTLTYTGCFAPKPSKKPPDPKVVEKVEEVAEIVELTEKELKRIQTLRKINEVLAKTGEVFSYVFKAASTIAFILINIFSSNILQDPFVFRGNALLQNLLTFFIDDIPNLVLFFSTQRYHCVGTYLGFSVGTILVMLTTIQAWKDEGYKYAKNSIEKIKFCGHEWFSYNWDTYDYNNYYSHYNEGAKTQETKWPVFGVYDNSRAKNVAECINGKDDIIKNNACSKLVSNIFQCEHNCDGIKATSRDIRNRNYREFLYQGQEYQMLSYGDFYIDVEKDKPNDDNRVSFVDYEYTDCIDPRLPEIKGYKTLEQRYYFRGNEKANFACNRFYYDSAYGCMLNENSIEDKSLLNDKNDIYYKIDFSENLSFEKDYGDKCREQFERARKCCHSRSRNFICLQKVDLNNNLIAKIQEHTFCFANLTRENDYELVSNLFELVQNKEHLDRNKTVCSLFLSGADNELLITRDESINFEASKLENTNYVCVYSQNACPYDYRLNAGLNYKASFCDSPLLEGDDSGNEGHQMLKMANHFNVKDCKNGYFYNSSDSLEIKKEKLQNYVNFVESTGSQTLSDPLYSRFVLEQMQKSVGSDFNVNDFKILYDFNELKFGEIKKSTSDVNGLIAVENKYKSELSKYPSLQNTFDRDIFSGSADEVKKQKEIFNNSMINKKDKIESGEESLTIGDYNLYNRGISNQVKNFCQYRAHCVEVESENSDFQVNTNGIGLFFDSSCSGTSNNSRMKNTIGLTLGLVKQLSTPIVECIYESLSNLTKGIAGASLCKAGYSLNTLGYCGSDDQSIIELKIKNGDTAYLDNRYQKLNGTRVIKGYQLAEEDNPFRVLQKYLLRITYALWCLFISYFALTKLLDGTFSKLSTELTAGQLSSKILTFAIVLWLSVGTGIQKVVFDYLIKFSMGVYDLSSQIFSSMLDYSPYNTVLNETIGVQKIKLKKKRTTTNSINQNVSFKFCFRKDIFGNLFIKETNLTNGLCPSLYTLNKDDNIIFVDTEKPVNYNSFGKLIIRDRIALNVLVSFINNSNSNLLNKLTLVGITEKNNEEIDTHLINELWNNNLVKEEKINKFKVKQKFNYTEGEVLKKYNLCFYYDYLNNLLLQSPDSNNQCPQSYQYQKDDNLEIELENSYSKNNEIIYKNSLIIKNNFDIQSLLYFIDKYNKTNVEKFYLVGLNKDNVEILTLSDINFWNPNYDGCFFSTQEYPEGKQYLSLYDTLDCKLMKYIGVTMSDGLPNLFTVALMNLVPSFFEGIPVLGTLVGFAGKLYGIIANMIFMLLFTFLMGYFQIIVKAIFVFLSSTLSLSILMFAAPIVLPFLLFEKTKKMFDTWLAEVVGCLIKPILNLSVILLFTSFLDSFVFSGVVFKDHKNSGRQAVVTCDNNNASVICFLNETPKLSNIKSLFENGAQKALAVLINVLVAIALVKFGDSLIDQMTEFVNNFIGFDSSSNMAGAGAQGMGEMKDSLSKGKELAGGAQEFAKNTVDYGKNVAISAGAGIDKMRQTARDERISALNKKLEKDPTNEKLKSELSSLESKNFDKDAAGRFMMNAMNPGQALTERISKKLDKDYNNHSIHAKRFIAGAKGFDALVTGKWKDLGNVIHKKMQHEEDINKATKLGMLSELQIEEYNKKNKPNLENRIVTLENENKNLIEEIEGIEIKIKQQEQTIEEHNKLHSDQADSISESSLNNLKNKLNDLRFKLNNNTDEIIDKKQEENNKYAYDLDKAQKKAGFEK